MKKSNFACFCYPTTTLFVDDNLNFLDTIALEMSDRLYCKAFNNPKDVLACLADTATQNKILRNRIKLDMDSDCYQHASLQLPVQFDIADLYKHAYDLELSNEVSVLVLDYAMPMMNGGELSRKVSALGLPVKIIVLTGEADEHLAVELFNEGVIDKFLFKGDPNLSNKLFQAISELQKQYFHDLTYPIIKGLAADHQSALGDAAFPKFFEEICTRLLVSSYYLIDPAGSFVLIDKQGNITYLIISTQEAILETASEIENGNGDPLVVASIREGKEIPYFATFDVHANAVDGADIRAYLYPAQKFRGEQPYAYALVKSLNGFDFDPRKIVKFSEQMLNVRA